VASADEAIQAGARTGDFKDALGGRPDRLGGLQAWISRSSSKRFPARAGGFTDPSVQ